MRPLPPLSWHSLGNARGGGGFARRVTNNIAAAVKAVAELESGDGGDDEDGGGGKGKKGGRNALCSHQDMLHYFCDALHSNPLITNKINQRRFMLADLMEDVAAATAQPKSHLLQASAAAGGGGGGVLDGLHGSLGGAGLDHSLHDTHDQSTVRHTVGSKRRQSEIDPDAPYGVEIT